MTENTFSQDLAFLQKHVNTVTLSNAEGAAIAIVPQYQGRTMTSTSSQENGKSYGYINYDAIASSEVSPQINLYGGEDRVWVSPEGGQYSIFFDPQVEMSFENWRTPPELDTHAFDLIDHQPQSVRFQKDATFTNWSGTQFKTKLEREVKLLDRQTASKHLQIDLPEGEGGVQLCAHESHNTLTNVGSQAWQPEPGLIGIWMLCMSKPAPAATLIVPFRFPSAGEEGVSLADVDQGKIVNADYFGKLQSDRLVVDRDAKLIYFRGDGQMRSKLGLTFDRVTPRLGSWDPQRGVLSIVEFNLPEQALNGYSNNLWEMQERPYDGDVINCYNDGLNESGKSLGAGGFYELETLSPALALGSGQAYTHLHRTIRMEATTAGSEAGRLAISRIAAHIFGADLDEIERQFS